MPKQIKSLADAQAAINDLYNRQELLKTKSWDFHGLQIKNAGAATDPNDYVIFSQLKFPTPPDNVDNDFYTIVWSKDGIVEDGEKSPPFVVGDGREGKVTQVWVVCVDEPSGGDLIVNIELNRINPQDSTVSTSTLLQTDLHLPANTTNPVFSSKFVSPVPTLGNGCWLNKKIITGSNAGYVSIGLVVSIIGNNAAGRA